MEKTAQRKTYRDPGLNKIIQEKAAWNKQVSALINDLIHFKKSMNGWPSKYYKERTRITQPVPVDLSGILNQIAGEFQDIASRGNGILQEQATFSKEHMKKKTEHTLGRLERMQGPIEGPAEAPPTGPNLTQQLSKGLASSANEELVKLAFELEEKYLLESQASNPFSRFITHLFTPKFGFGEGARIRRLRMTMLDSCVKAYKELKRLQKEVVKSSKSSIINSHKMMTIVWNHWNVVQQLLKTLKIIKPGPVSDQGAEIEDPDLKKERELEEGRESEEAQQPEALSQEHKSLLSVLKRKLEDYRKYAHLLKTSSPTLRELNSAVENIMGTPKDQQALALLRSNVDDLYNKTISEFNSELHTGGTSFEQIYLQFNQNAALGKNAQLQRWLGKTRHQVLPGATSGSRLEIYRFIDQIKRDLNHVMDLLEKGFDQEALAPAITQVHREMSTLRTMVRSLYASDRPEQALTPFF